VSDGAVAPLLINDARAAPAFADHPALRLYGIQSYIAVPLMRRDGSYFGTLCAFDPQPTDLTEDNFEIFHLLANLIAFELEADEAERHAREVAERLAQQSRELARLEERERIAMDLHDGVIQSLYSVVLGLGAEQLHAGQTDRAIGKAIDGINRVIQEIRNNIFDLRLRDLGEGGLRGGIEVLAEELRINTLVQPHVDVAAVDSVERCVDADAVTNLLYITREATSNVIRHARANTVTIRLATTDDELVLTIRDNGRGFDPEATESRLGDGLRNIRDRARAIGGTFSIASLPGQGTAVCVRVPCKPPGEGV
jgi:two-component system, NarL family, sensor histidine kinase DevS